MLLLPIVLIVVIGVVAYKLSHRGAGPSAGDTPAAGGVVAVGSFLPTTIEGRLGVAAFVVGLLPWALVNVIQVPYLSIGIQVVAMALTGVARFVRHDRSTAVLIGCIVSSLAVVATIAFLLGEVVIGHD